jgi:phosphatidylglycerophosphate synthase
MADATLSAQTPPFKAWIVGECDVSLWSIGQVERIRRSLARAGVVDVREGPYQPGDGDLVILIRADTVLEQPLVSAILRSSGSALAIPNGDGWIAGAANVSGSFAEAMVRHMAQDRLPIDTQLPLGVRRLGASELASSYNHALRKRAVPYACSLSITKPLEAEWALFHGSYKGVTDFVTKWVWPWPAFWVTRGCARVGVSPNTVTGVSFLLMLAAMILFGDGYFLTGLVAAWAMTFLDTVDGKLARVTLTSSKWGNVLDHGIDLIHPPFWYWAWWFAVVPAAGGQQRDLLTIALWVIVGGYVLGRVQEGLFIWWFGIEMHAWRRIDSWFRLFTARRNPNLALLTVAALLDKPALGFLAVAVWTVLSLAFHFVRIGQAVGARLAGRPVTSWLSEPASSTA